MQLGMPGQVQQAQGPVRLQHAPLALEEGGAAVDQRLRDPAVGLAQQGGADPHVGCRAAIDLLRLRFGLAALHPLQHEGIAGLRQGARTPVPGHQHRVGVQPFHVLLAAGEVEAAGDEAAGGGVELADLHRVAAAVGELDEAAGLLRRQAGRPLEDPVAAFGLRQGVEVQERLPRRVRRGVAGRRGHPPDALHMSVVLPEIGDPVAQEAGGGDPVLRRQHGQRLAAVGLVAGIGLQSGSGAGVLPRHPGQRPGAVHFLQPAIGVRRAGGGGGDDRCGQGGGGAQQQQGERRAGQGAAERTGQRDHGQALRTVPADGGTSRAHSVAEIEQVA